MEEKKLIIYGIGRFAEYVRYVFDLDSYYKTIGFCIERSFTNDREFNNLPLYSFEDLETDFPPEDINLFIAVGQNSIRKKYFEQGIKKGFSMATYISSKARTWPNLKYGKNVFIDEGSVIQPFTVIEDNSILFTSQIGHHTFVGKNSLISGAKTGGNVKIGENCYIGLNASVKQNIKVADNSIIGMGCIIEKDTLPNGVYTHKGTTKRKILSTQISSRFLK